MWPSRSKMIHLPSGDWSTDIQVPSVVSKSMSRVLPRAWVVSHSFEVFSSAAIALAKQSRSATTPDVQRQDTLAVILIESPPNQLRITTSDELPFFCAPSITLRNKTQHTDCRLQYLFLHRLALPIDFDARLWCTHSHS